MKTDTWVVTLSFIVLVALAQPHHYIDDVTQTATGVWNSFSSIPFFDQFKPRN